MLSFLPCLVVFVNQVVVGSYGFNTLAFSTPWHNTRTSTSRASNQYLHPLALSKPQPEEPVDDDDNDKSPGGGESKVPADLSWLRKAMDSSSDLMPAEEGVLFVESKPGISGFAVDPKLGFVVVMVGGDRATYAVVSPKDKQQVRSAEALCLVQLAGGLDLGTPILSPDILAKLVAEETRQSPREIRAQVTLRQVKVVVNNDRPVETKAEEASVLPESTPERDAAIEEQAPKVREAVNKLPGLLGECSLELVSQALRKHSDDEGTLDRSAFTALLDTLRRTINEMEPSKVKFILVVSLNDIKLEIEAPSAVIGVGLALRYKVDVQVSKECQIEGFDAMEIASIFPNFRPVKELEEDAKIMDGFIPTMFNQASPPDNEDKL